MKRWFRDRFTRFFVRIYRRSEATPGEFSGGNGDFPVYWFSNEDSVTVAQVTPFVGTITLNKARFDNISPEAATVVIEHERGHYKRSRFTSVRYWVLIVGFVLGSWKLISIATGFPDTITSFLSLWGALGLIVAGTINFKLEELMADFHALDATSEEVYLGAHREISEQRPSGKTAKAVRLLMYPKPERVVRLHQTLERHGLFQFFVR